MYVWIILSLIAVLIQISLCLWFKKLPRMGFDLIGWAEATPGAGGFIAAGKGDDFYSIESSLDGIYLQEGKVALAEVMAFAESTGSYIYLTQPRLKPHHYFTRICNWDKDVGTSAITLPGEGITKLHGRPLILAAKEWLKVYMTNATDEDALIGAIVGNEVFNQAALDRVRPTHILRGTVDQTVTALTWTSGTITLAEDLPDGHYAVVGMNVGAWLAGDNMAALARLIFRGKPGDIWRPGVATHPLQADKSWMKCTHGWHDFSHWPLDPLMSFKSDQVPRLEVLSPLAYTDFEVNLLLQAISPPR